MYKISNKNEFKRFSTFPFLPFYKINYIKNFHKKKLEKKSVKNLHLLHQKKNVIENNFNHKSVHIQMHFDQGLK